MELSQIEASFMVESTTPAQIANMRVLLSGKYSYAMNKLEEILLQKPIIWNKMRPEHKSDKATDREWESSELGLEELHWKMQIKKIEKMMSAGKTLIDAKTTEAYSIT